jgi:hypothetical protein
MWNQSLFIVSLMSAVMSAALGIVFFVTLIRLGALTPVEHLGETEPTVSVVMPARNEQRDLAAALRSVLAQEGVQLQIIVVNDHSSDSTGEIADSIAESDERVSVIHDPPLPPGWLGKTNAMEQGARAATGEFIVFTDADVIHQPRCFGTAIAELRRKQVDFLSLCPNFECQSFWENVLLPHCFIAGAVQFCLQGVNDPESPKGAAAGAFMLMRRRLLEQMNGLECIRSEFLDDVALARAVKRQGCDARLQLAPGLLKVRLFKGNADAFWGLSKNILGAVDQVWMAIPAMFLPIFVYWAPLVSVLVGLCKSVPALMAAGGLAYAVQFLLLFPVSRICTIRWTKAAFFPAAAAPVVCCFAKALYHRLVSGSVDWRGRVVTVSRKRS